MNRMCVVSLSLLLLLAVGIQGMVTDLRNNCRCRTMSSKALPVRLLMELEVFPRSPSCDHTEYIATLKHSGTQECLNPKSPAVKKMLEKFEQYKKSRHGSRRRIRP